eukprot:m.266995 g.266995  ORF g.266995 m.266995 type:complete len:112 (-) comp15634_c5_seq3:2598-2933(-)
MHSARVPLAQHAYTSAAPDTHDTHMSSLSDCCGKAPVQSTYAPGTRVTTVYPYESARPDEVDFEEHQTIIVLNPEQHLESGWIYGQVEATGATGIFPANYVELQQAQAPAP